MRLIGVEREHVIAAGLGNPGLHRARVAAPPFADDARAERLRRLARAVGGPAVDNDYLVTDALVVEQRDQPGDQDPQVFGLIDNRQYYGNIHSD